MSGRLLLVRCLGVLVLIMALGVAGIACLIVGNLLGAMNIAGKPLPDWIAQMPDDWLRTALSVYVGACYVILVIGTTRYVFVKVMDAAKEVIVSIAAKCQCINRS